MPGLPSNHVLAILRLKQWTNDRTLLNRGHSTNLRRVGWVERRQSQQDARIVRVLAFEKAFAKLPLMEQLALAALYRDGQSHATVAATIGCSPRKVEYLLPIAREHLAEILDRHDLL